MKRLFLIGYMGTGKTTVGRELAKHLGLDFIDVDHYIEARFLKSVSQIFAEKGEDSFREIERKILREVGDFEDIVIATGGGAPCFFDNIDYLNQQGQTIYLKASAQALAERLSMAKGERPLLKDKTKEELIEFVTENLSKREVYYNQAKIVFDTDGLINESDVDAYVSRLLELLEK